MTKRTRRATRKRGGQTAAGSSIVKGSKRSTPEEEKPMNAIHPQTSERQETLDPRIPAAGPANTDTHAQPEPGLDDQPQARLYGPARESVPVVEDPAVVAGKEAAEATAAFNAIPGTVDENSPEFKTTEEKMTEADAAFADAPVMSAAGALAKMQELKALVISPELDVDEKGLDVRHLETVVTFLEGGPGGAAPDPAVASFAELKAASAAFDALPDEVDEQVDEAAYKRFSGAREAVYDVVPVSLAGVAAKVRAMVEYHSDTYEKSPGLDRTVESMLPFLEGGAAALPPTVAEPDPIVALFNEWGAIQDEAAARDKADPKAVDPNIEKQQDKLFARHSAIENCIVGTDAASVGGLAVKLRLMLHTQYPVQGLPDLHHTPAKDIDLKAMIEGWRDGDTQCWEDDLLIGALRDAERLAGAS